MRLRHLLGYSTALCLTALSGIALADPPAAPMATITPVKLTDKQIADLRKQYGDAVDPDEMGQFVDARPEQLRPYFRALYLGGERNSVLNLSRLGLASMEMGRWSDAEHAFDAALLRIESVYGKNKQSQAARSLFHRESNKDWKGEPYERAMAYYYRGLLYLRKGDYNNAHASFKEAEYQDTVSEAEEFQSDFASMDFLIGWSAQCAGDNGQTDFDAAAKIEASLAAPVVGDNILLIAELGHGPVKVRDGKQKEKLVFREAEGFPETTATFTLTPATGQAQSWPGHPGAHLYYQATTRGGRAMDGILDGKASWKSGTEAVGSATTSVGLQMMNSSNSAGGDPTAGAVVAMAGLLFSAFSTAMKTDADIRQWDQLPDNIALTTARMKGPFTPSLSFAGTDGPIPIVPPVIMAAQAGKCGIVWARSRTAMLDPDTPGDDPKVRASVARKKDVIVKDRAFHAALGQTFGD